MDCATNNIPLPIALLDSSGKVIQVNDEYKSIFVNLTDVANTVCEGKLPLFSQQWVKGLNSQKRFSVTTSCTTGSGKKPVCNIIANPTGQGDALQWTVCFVLNTFAEDYIRSEDNVTHEIRTPLHGIRGMIDALSQTTLDAYQADCVKYLRYSGDALSQVVNYLLDISKVECGMLELQRAPFSLHDLASNLVNSYKYAVSKDVDISLKYHTAQDATTFLGDELRMRQILSNLISNAIKYTDKGNIIVDVVSEAKSPTHVVKVAVMDTGKGIHQEVLEQLFDAFTQFDNDVRKKFNGTGLGLYLCKKLCVLMGGHIGVESVLNEGSTFWFTVEMPTSDEKPIDTVSDDPESEYVPLQHRTYRAMVVEDNVINQQVMIKMLERMGLNYTLANNGEEAVALAEQLEHDIILMDCDMPVMDGFEASKRIRGSNTSLCSLVPIVAVTASSSDSLKLRCLHNGMNDVLVKPVSRPQLMRTVKKWLPVHLHE